MSVLSAFDFQKLLGKLEAAGGRERATVGRAPCRRTTGMGETVWAVRILLILALAVAVNVVFWDLLPRYGVEAPAWFVLAFDVLFVVPVFWLLPSVRSRPVGQVEVAAGALAKWGKGVGEFPTVDESRDRLHRAGWSVGEVGTASTWRVCGANGENQTNAAGASQAEAWHRACEQAAAVGMLAPAQEGQGRRGGIARR
jgi:hypothetical protein